jgi:putative ABC transport system permease protein
MSWRPLLRIARRDALRARGRSLLVVLMVMLPVAGVAFIDVMLRTAAIDGTERLAVELGPAADAKVVPQSDGAPVVQEPTATFASGAQSGAPPAPTPRTDPTTLFPAGSRWITDDREQVTAKTTDGLTSATFRELDYRDPLAAGTVRQTTGRAPRSTSEVVTSRRLLATLGLQVGDDVTLTRPARTLRIVGTYHSLGDVGSSTFIGLPGTAVAAVRELQHGEHIPQLTYLVDTPAPVTWQQVLGYNARGLAVYSRFVVENPPPRSQVPYYADQPDSGRSGFDFQTVGAIALVVGLAVLEVALLAGAAFAVGARRQRRALGLLAATGGTGRHVRGVVLAQGLVLGTAGGIAGVLAGLGSGYAAIPLVNRFTTRGLLGADVRPLELSGLVLIGVFTGLVAAVVPARAAARQDVVAALRGRTGITQTRKRLPILGLGVTAVGVAMAVAGGALALRLNSADAGGQGRLLTLAVIGILGGAVLTQLGLIVATPALVGAVGRLGRVLPLAPRLAVRDAARHRTRTAPAVAAVLTAVAGSIALSLFVSALSDHDRRNYLPQLGYGQFALNAQSPPVVSGLPQNDVQAHLAAISRIAPPDSTIPVRTLAPRCLATAKTCRYVAPGAPRAQLCPPTAVQLYEGVQPTNEQFAASQDDPRCSDAESGYNSRFGGPVVGSYDDFVRLTGIRSEDARRALTRGGMVVFSRLQVRDGVGVLDVTDSPTSGDVLTPPPVARPVPVPAAYVDARGKRFLSAFVAPEVAQRVGVQPVLDALLLQYRTPLSDNTEERVRAELAKLGTGDTYFQVERGYRDRYGIGLLALLLGSAVITLGAAGIATGLAQADARADHATLAAVGSPPRVRRSLAAWQAATVAGLGAVLGIASGFVPMTAYLYADPEMNLVVPWRNVTTIGLVVPAFAAAGGWLLTRSRLPLERRMEA